MNRVAENDLYRCGLCHRSVDSDMRDRARRVWQPLIICERCIRETDRPRASAASLAS